MPTLQFFDISESQVKVVNEDKGPQKKVEMLESDLAAMTFESMMDKMKVVALEETSATLAFEIMQLKMGGN